ncbi:PLP-dependent aminotransferase family protein [uncultured Bdellovibrio sp.]|uniref:MocR-like pyridoxine biosynthesis transcription factor PdxR n=1 Tax=Bdellovibrio sp. HCB-162 TaxID=3394234 RepID=UPI0025D861A3|nr:PLP-dependent aminotransferase family protein [uncultured Bdellovibrio sp.]
MRELLITLDKTKKQKYQALAEGLRLSIKQGKVRPGERLPSSRDLARIFKMHRHTVMTALAELEAEGWIVSKTKRYYQVTETLPDTFLRSRPSLQSFALPRQAIKVVRSAPDLDFVPVNSFKHSFPSGFPDVRLFPMKEFKSLMSDALTAKGVLNYGDPAGYPMLLKEIKDYLRRVRNVDGREVIVTNGSQEALFFLAQALIAPGDKIAVEALGYPPALSTFQYAGGKLVPITVDKEGLCVDELEEKLKKQKIKFLYLTPLHQYPTTVTLSAERRLKLYELALKYGMLIIEDDYDHEFHFVSQPVAPLASFDPAGIVLYISTFSKILFPSARVGFMAVPEIFGKEIAKLKRISSRQNEQILQVAIALWMKSGGFEKHLRKMRRIYEERKKAMIEDLQRWQKLYPRISWAEPDGGMALWLELSVNTTRFAQKMKSKSILVAPEQSYRVDGKSGTHVRLGFSGFSPEENRASLKALFTAE